MPESEERRRNTEETAVDAAQQAEESTTAVPTEPASVDAAQQAEESTTAVPTEPASIDAAQQAEESTTAVPTEPEKTGEAASQGGEAPSVDHVVADWRKKMGSLRQQADDLGKRITDQPDAQARLESIKSEIKDNEALLAAAAKRQRSIDATFFDNNQTSIEKSIRDRLNDLTGEIVEGPEPDSSSTSDVAPDKPSAEP
jgi:23S rRNA A1618 N6-methylase RlmF